MAEAPLIDRGPSGFLEIGQNLLVVDYGKIYQGVTQVGILYEDGLIQGMDEPLGVWHGLKTIEELPGLAFKGIDSQGLQLELPGQGPTGGLTYNNLVLNVIFGRIATQAHQLVGKLDDDGSLFFRDPRYPAILRKMDENCQLATTFQGVKSNGQAWQFEFVRALHKADKAYWENEIIRYFEDMDRVHTAQKKYVFETMRFFSMCGLLQLVRKSQGTAGLGNVKHGASGVTGVRSGNVTLDKEEFEKEVSFYKRFGALMAIPARIKPFIEVRLNLVVAHEYGHQLEFCLSQAAASKISEIYEKRLRVCDRLHAAPLDYEGEAELLLPQQVDERIYISGYARSSMHEYFAESVGAFAVQESRAILKRVDPDMHALLSDMVYCPEKMLSINLHEAILNLQTSLRVGGVLQEDLLDK